MSPRTVITWAENAEIFERYRLRLPAHLPQQVRRAGAAARGRVLSALLRRGTAGKLGQRGAELSIALDMSEPSRMTSNIKPQDRRQGSADRAVQARGRRLPARDRAASPSSRSPSRPSGPAWRAARRGCRSRRASSRAATPRSCAATPIRWRCKLACHDPAVHRKLDARRPAGARGVRGGRAGARRGDRRAPHGRASRKNLAAMLDDRFHRGKFDDITDRADAPIEDAVAMMVRERLTGLTPPPAARKLVDLWRPLIEERAGARSRPAGEAGRATSAASATSSTICSTRSTWARSARAIPRTRTTRTARTSRRQKQGEDGERRGVRGRRAHEHGGDAKSPPRRCRTARARRSTRPPPTCRTTPTMGDSESRREPWRPRQHGSNEPRGPDYQAFIAKFDEIDRAPRICASRKSSTGCAPISTSSSRICRAWWRGSPTACSAA